MDEILNSLLQKLDDANDRSDWSAVEDIAGQILAVDPESADAQVLLKLARRKMEATWSGSTEQSNVVGIPLRDAFVGRDSEMARLRAALDDALCGQGRIVMLAGEPGIGKTRTAEELGVYAESRNVRILWGRAHEDLGAPPYWPWVQVIRSYAHTQETEQLRLDLGRGAGLVARIVPELNDRLPEIEPPGDLKDPEAERFRLFDAVTTFFKAVASDCSMLAILDNLHWADEPSLKLLEFIAREIQDSRLMILGTYRDTEIRRTHPLSRTLGDLTRERRFERIPLRRFAHADVERIIEHAGGFKPAPAFVDAVLDHTEGNALFVTEVVRLLAQRGQLKPERLTGRGDWELYLPESVRETIGRRLDILSESCNRVLTVASVVGREFAADALQPLVDDISKQQLIEMLEEAQAAHIIQELADELGHYRFSHKLVQETLRDELSTTQRVKLHGKIAETLEALYGDSADKHAGELAAHYAEAQILLGTEKLVHYSLIAGKSAGDLGAEEAAMVIYKRAIGAVEDAPIEGELAEIYLELRGCQTTITGDIVPFDTLSQVFDYYENLQDTTKLLATTWWMHYYPLLDKKNVSKSTVNDYARRALRLIDEKSHNDPSLIAAASALRIRLGDGFDEVEGELKRALSIAEGNGDDGQRRDVYFGLALCCGNSGRRRSAVEHYELSGKYAQESEPIWNRILRHVNTGSHLYHLGDLDGASRHTEALAQIADQVRVPKMQASNCGGKSHNQQTRGNWQQARELSDEGLRIADRLGRPSAEMIHLLCDRALLEYEIGDFDAGEIVMAQLLEFSNHPELSFHFYVAVAGGAVMPKIVRITGTSRWIEEATSQYEALSERYYPDTTASSWLAIATEDGAAAAKLYPKLLSEDPEARPFNSRFLGLLAFTAGDVDTAIGHFQDAYTFTRDSGFRPDHAWVCCDFADALIARGTDDDKKRAGYYLEEGRALATKLGMVPLQQRIEGRLERLVPKEARGFPDGLTGREVEVLRLIAGGMTNQEIGYELNISTRTVTTHVTHIYEKTGVVNRAEAAAYALRQGLMDGQK